MRATTFYSVKDDGLKQPWFGKVWLNPPYGRFGPPFVRKAVEELKAGRIEQTLILLNVNHIANGWFNDAMRTEHLICLPRKRVNFTSPLHITTSAKTGSVLIAIGIPRDRFEEHFGQLGKIAFLPEATP